MDELIEYYRLIDEYEELHENERICDQTYSINEITDILYDLELISNDISPERIDFERLVFFYGEKDEVYCREEIEIIEKTKEIYGYSQYYKNTMKSMIPIRIYYANLKGKANQIYTIVGILKILNKAFMNSFSIIFYETDIGFVLGCRKFSDKETDNCIFTDFITNKKELTNIINNFCEIRATDNFSQYYSDIYKAISFKNDDSSSLEDRIIRRKGIDYSYIKNLREIGDIYEVDFSKEIGNYIDFYEEYDENENFQYNDELLEAVNNSKYIKSNKINPMELLFEAEEYLKLSNSKEETINSIIYSDNNITANSNINIDDDRIKEITNPEEMVKLIRKLKGI
jgi:hypothetical protein